MAFRPKEYLRPSSVSEVTSILEECGDRAKIIAGGATFYEMARRGMIPKVEKIVDISRLGLNYVKDDGGVVKIGAMTTIAELGEHSLLDHAFLGGLRDALYNFTPTQIKNVATVGGEVCAGVSSLDLPPILLSLDANVEIVGSGGQREERIQEFFLDYFLTDLRRGEFVVAVNIPKPPQGTGSAFLSFKRNSVDLAVVNACSTVTLDEGGKVRSVQIGLGGVARTPLRTKMVERELLGRKMDESSVAKALEKTRDLKPISSIHAPSEYKLEVSKILIRDTLSRASKRAMGGN